MSSASSTAAIGDAAPAGLHGLPAAARSVLGLLRHLRGDRLEVVLPDGRAMHFGEHAVGEHAPLQVRVLDWRVFSDTLRRGDVGFGEGYFEQRWTTPDLPRLLRLLLLNRDALQRTLYGSAWGTLLLRLRHALRANSRRGSRHNIHAHYDIGNAFYELWLDPGMNYSSALFDAPGLGLEQAQQRKIERVLRQLDVQPGSRVLEIGCGWGAFAESAARRGLRLDGVTLSREQLQWGRERLRAAGLDRQARLHLLDYRDMAGITPAGGFDAVASIEMFEAVGERYWKGFFRVLADSLRTGGRACVQSITIDEALFPSYRGGTDFIQQYIFPGGMLPTRKLFRQLAAAAGLEVVDEFAFGRDYATTLAAWRQRFAQLTQSLQEQGFDQRFRLLWDFYLAYCEAGFAQGSTDVVQFTLRKSGRP
jgi:cyclopropane-fatty-acyl-phospholipid synthase